MLILYQTLPTMLYILYLHFRCEELLYTRVFREQNSHDMSAMWCNHNYLFHKPDSTGIQRIYDRSRRQFGVVTRNMKESVKRVLNRFLFKLWSCINHCL